MEPVVVVELVSLKWMVGIIMLPGATALVSILWILRIIKAELSAGHKAIIELLQMHHEADKHGFGTETTNEMLRQTNRTLRDVVYYMKWGVEKMTGESPPPPVDGD